jgi:phage baseplate assembly protein W
MSDGRLGRDLRVVIGPPGFEAHDAASLDLQRASRPSRQRSAPLSLRRPAPRDPSLPPPAQGWQPEPATAREVHDLGSIEQRENVAQALVLRLLTPLGSLADLGHAEYGSRLGELVGRRKTSALRGLCRAFILEAVRREPRVEDRPLAIIFDPEQETASSFVVEIAVRTVPDGEAVTVGVEVDL